MVCLRRHRCIGSCRCRRPRPDHPGGTSSVDLGQLDTRRRRPAWSARPRDSPARPRARRSVARRARLAVGCGAPARRALAAVRRELDLDPWHGRGHADRDQLEPLLGVAVAVALLVLAFEGLAQSLGRRVGLSRRPPARTPGRGSAARRPREFGVGLMPGVAERGHRVRRPRARSTRRSAHRRSTGRFAARRAGAARRRGRARPGRPRPGGRAPCRSRAHRRSAPRAVGPAPPNAISE